MSAAIKPSDDCLYDEIARLRALVVRPVCLKRTLGLQPLEERVLRQLVALYPAVTRDRKIYLEVNGGTNFSSNLVAVIVSRLRRKLAPHGLEILTRHGKGFVLTPESHAKALQILGVSL